jgi:hypothetical protein
MLIDSDGGDGVADDAQAFGPIKVESMFEDMKDIA